MDTTVCAMDSTVCLSQMQDSAQDLGKDSAEKTGINHNSKDMVTLAKFIELARQQFSAQNAGHQGNELRMNVDSSSDADLAIKHVASIVLVLAGLGLVRGGRDPTDVERQLQAEAYGRLGYLIQGLAPKDVVPAAFIENMIEDLGLRKSKEKQVKTFDEILEEFRAPTIPSPSKVEQAEPMQDVSEPNYSMMQQMSIDGREHSRQWPPAQQMMSPTGDSNEPMQVDSSHDEHVSPATGVSPVMQENVHVQKQPERVLNTQQQLVHAIQEVLQSKYGDCQIQPAYPKMFMSAPMPCEICKVIIKDTASALACDSCEKLYHLRCLQAYAFKGIPKGDWHCANCTKSDGGQEKPKTAKYGRVKPNFSFTKIVSANQGGSPRMGLPQNTSPNAKTTVSGRKHPASDEIANDSKRICVDSGTAVVNGSPSKAVNPVLSPTPKSQVHNASKSAVVTPQGHKVSPGKSQQQTPVHTPTTRGRSAAKATSKDPQSNKKAADQQKSTETSKAPDSAGQGHSSTPIVAVEWIGDSTQKHDGKVFYSACCVSGCVYRLQEYALFRPETPNVPPYIARLQALWEDVNTGSKWVRVNWCYYPADMASIAGRPSNPETNEVYESNHGDNNLVGSIKGPCMVLRQDAYRKEMERRKELISNGAAAESLMPTFLCRWFYDAPRATFKPAN